MRDYILLRQAERYLQKMQSNDQVRIFHALNSLIHNIMLTIKYTQFPRKLIFIIL